MVTLTTSMRNPHDHQVSDTVETLDLPFFCGVAEGLAHHEAWDVLDAFLVQRAECFRRHRISPEGLAGEGRELGIGREQNQTFQFGLGSQHAVKRIAMGLAVTARP